MTAKPAATVQLPDLTAKQRDVLALVADNRTSKEIAGLLGISESAVNQRIEIVRSRLGGLPRGQLARLYRQEFAPGEGDEAQSLTIWQKIHLPEGPANGEEAEAEGISAPDAVRSHTGRLPVRDGSQLSAYFYDTGQSWLSRDDLPMALTRSAAIAGIILAAIALAAGITQIVGGAFSGG